MRFKISGININNESQLHLILASGGFGGASIPLNFTERELDIRDSEFRHSAGIKEDEVFKMLGELVFKGFKVERITTVEEL